MSTAPYWIAFIVYSLIVIGMGWYIWRKERGSGEATDNQAFWSASRDLSGWSSGLSISASMMSISWSCVYGVQLFYWYGIGGAWLLIIPWLITMSGFYVLTPLFRKLRVFSQPELLGKRFGDRSRQLLAPVLFLVFIIWAGAEIYAAGITIAPFLGISVPLALFLIAFVVAAYSFTGGFEAVVSTDKIQFGLVALFITLIGGAALYGVYQCGGDLTALWKANHLAPKNSTKSGWFISPGIALVAVTFIAYLPGWLVETDVWLRLQAARNNSEARKGVLIAGANSFVFVGLLPMLIGLAALALYPPVFGEIPARLQDGSLIFTALMQDFTPVWLNVLLGIGLVAAAMSTVDTCGNVVALSLSYDLLEPRLQKSWSAAQLNRLARWASVAAIFLAFIYALFTQSLWDIFYLSSGILTTTVLIPVIAAFRQNVRPVQVNASILAGFIATILFYFLEKKGRLAAFEPRWLASTGLGYILFGLAAAFFAFLIFRSPGKRKQYASD